MNPDESIVKVYEFAVTKFIEPFVASAFQNCKENLHIMIPHGFSPAPCHPSPVAMRRESENKVSPKSWSKSCVTKLLFAFNNVQYFF
jgi:hypothetical protein